MDAPADAGASSTADFRAVSASFAPGGETDVTPDVLTRFGVSENWKAVTAVAATSSNAAVLRGRISSRRTGRFSERPHGVRRSAPWFKKRSLSLSAPGAAAARGPAAAAARDAYS